MSQIFAKDQLLTTGKTLGPYSFTETNEFGSLNIVSRSLMLGTVIIVTLKDAELGNVLRTARIESSSEKRTIGLENTPNNFTVEVVCLSGKAVVSLGLDTGNALTAASLIGNTQVTSISDDSFVPVVGQLSQIFLDESLTIIDGIVSLKWTGLVPILIRAQVDLSIKKAQAGPGGLELVSRIFPDTNLDHVTVGGAATVTGGNTRTMIATFYGGLAIDENLTVEVANLTDDTDLLVTELLFTIQRVGYL